MNVSLIGYRGAGKSTIAKLLAERTGFALRDLDALIVTKAGMSIPKIVEKFGWDHFRDLESAVLAAVVKGENQVLDCGGGIILREENRRLLKAAGPVIWLTADIPTIVARIGGDKQRPSLTGKTITDEVKEVLAEREPWYRETATFIFSTEAETPETVVQAVQKILL